MAEIEAQLAPVEAPAPPGVLATAAVPVGAPRLPHLPQASKGKGEDAFKQRCAELLSQVAEANAIAAEMGRKVTFAMQIRNQMDDVRNVADRITVVELKDLATRCKYTLSGECRHSLLSARHTAQSLTLTTDGR